VRCSKSNRQLVITALHLKVHTHFNDGLKVIIVEALELKLLSVTDY